MDIFDYRQGRKYADINITRVELTQYGTGLDHLSRHGTFVTGQCLRFKNFEAARLLWDKLNKRERQSRRARLLRWQDSFHTQSDLEALRRIQDGCCYYSGDPLGETFASGNYHIDHLVPLSRGGSDSPINLALTSIRDNLRKNDKTKEEYLGWLGASTKMRARIKLIDLGRRLYFKDIKRDIKPEQQPKSIKEAARLRAAFYALRKEKA